jgi:hypothetical protein
VMPHPSKALSPIEVTELRIVMLVRAAFWMLTLSAT